MSLQKARIEEITDDTHVKDEQDDELPPTDSESDIDELIDESLPSTSKAKPKKKWKKKFKIAGNKDKLPDELVQKVMDEVKKEAGENGAQIQESHVREALQKLQIAEVAKGKVGIGGINAKDTGEHKFWATQPVPQPGEGLPEEDGYIEESKPSHQVRQHEYPLPKDFEWSTLDLDDAKQTKEVYDLLSLNYVEDDEASFRFQYSAEFLEWALKPPGYHKEWHIGVRVASNKKLVAFISGVPISLRVRGNSFHASEINYLCVHKKLRSKRLAPVLIKEVTRQCHLKGIFQAIYTAGVILPTPVSTCRYFHRSLNVPKLVDVKFTVVPRNMTLARMIRVNAVPSNSSIPGVREMEEKDIPEVAELFTRYMRRFEMVPVMTLEETRHQFLSGKGVGEKDPKTRRRKGQVVWPFVIEDKETHKITDFWSFYSLPSTVINATKYGVLEAAYLFYYATDVAFGPDPEGAVKTRVGQIIQEALISANQAEFDVFNALTLMDNVSVLKDHKFGPGDGYLNYYLYNWRTAPLSGFKAVGDVQPGKGVGVVML